MVLDSEPTADVTVTPASGDTGVATLSAASLTFTSSTWDTTQTVTVTGVDDDIDSDRSTSITHTASSSDQNYTIASGLGTVAVTLTDNDTAGVTVSETALTVTEASGTGQTASYTVVLDSEPTADVTVTPASGDTGVATLSAASLTFTSSTWDTTQTVTVTGVDDGIDNGDRSTSITHTASSTDPNYTIASGLGTVAVTLTDDDTAGVTVSETALTVTEASGTGQTASYTVVLDSEPTADVTVTPASGDTGVATLSAASLTFTSSTWDTTQTVTVTGVDDDSDSDRSTSITHTASSSDQNYTINSGLGTVAVTLTDDDTAGVTVSETALTVTEASGTGQTASYTVVLDSEPTADVTVTPASGDTGVATLSAASLTFTSSTWDTTQTVTVTGVDDDIDNGDRTTTITHTVAGADYASVTAANVEVTLIDDDPVQVDAGVDRTTVEGAQVTLSGAGSIYAEGSQPSFAWAQIAGPEVELSDPAAVMTRFTAPSGLTETTELTFALTVTDESGLDATDTVTVTVVVDLPVIDPTESDEIATVEIADLDPEDPAVKADPPMQAAFAPDDRRIVNVTPKDDQGNPVEQLRKPVELCLIVDEMMREAFATFVNDAVLLDHLTLLHYDASATAWEELPDVVVTTLEGIGVRVCAPVDKFSPFAVAVRTDPGVTLSSTHLEITEGEDATYTVALDVRPDGGEVDLVAEVEGDANVAIVAGGGEPARAIMLTFTSENWKQPRQITVRVSEDPDPDDETASIRSSDRRRAVRRRRGA